MEEGGKERKAVKTLGKKKFSIEELIRLDEQIVINYCSATFNPLGR